MAAATAAMVLSSGGGPLAMTAHARQGVGGPTAQATTTVETAVPKMSMGRVAAREVARALGRVANARIVTDRSVAFQNVDWTTAGGSLADVLKEFVAVLPKTTVLRTVYLPKEMAEADADALSLYLASLENLKNSSDKMQTAVIRPPAVTPPDADNTAAIPNMVEVMGRRLTPEQAAPLVIALDLRPVYLLAKPISVGDPVVRLGDMQTELIGLWMRMSPEQRKTSAEQQFDALINMDSAARRALFGSQMEQGQMFLQKLQNLPKEQSRQFWLDMTGGKLDGTGLPKTPAPPPAAGGNP